MHPAKYGEYCSPNSGNSGTTTASRKLRVLAERQIPETCRDGLLAIRRLQLHYHGRVSSTVLEPDRNIRDRNRHDRNRHDRNRSIIPQHPRNKTLHRNTTQQQPPTSFRQRNTRTAVKLVRRHTIFRPRVSYPHGVQLSFPQPVELHSNHHLPHTRSQPVPRVSLATKQALHQ